MAKRLKFPVRALGSSAPEPDLAALAAWAGTRTGKAGDLTTYQIETTLVPQVKAGVDLPCAGGPFYAGRWLKSIGGLDEKTVRSEMFAHPDLVLEDAIEIAKTRKGSFFAIPSPSSLGIEDRYFGNRDELRTVLYEVYRTLMREMRDCTIAGHVLIVDTLEEEDMAALAGKKAFFFLPDPSRTDLELLLEYQRDIAIPKDRIPDIEGLLDQFQIGRVLLLDPDEKAFKDILAVRDPDMIMTAGFCTESFDTYWQDLVAGSNVTLG
ncbi:MAG: hypothetical protein ABFC24_09090 [Methanoregulaceae archaeon]